RNDRGRRDARWNPRGEVLVVRDQNRVEGLGVFGAPRPQVKSLRTNLRWDGGGRSFRRRGQNACRLRTTTRSFVSPCCVDMSVSPTASHPSAPSSLSLAVSALPSRFGPRQNPDTPTSRIMYSHRGMPAMRSSGSVVAIEYKALARHPDGHAFA